jgi:hypothetical protein
MNEIILRFDKLPKEAAFDARVPVSVHFDGKESEKFDFINPLTDADLAEIRWYLENYYEWPSEIDHERARKLEGKLPAWGRALFEGVFANASAMRVFAAFDAAGDGDRGDKDRRLAIDTTEPRILRLPWELLRDEGGYLFSKNPSVSIRRRLHKTTGKPIQPIQPPVRILLVTSRPEAAGFIDPRSIAGPLLDALAGIPEQVEVEFLRPPSLAALDDRLRDESLPPVHIVHFDGHGVYDPGVGLGFLLFEDDEHAMHRVDAEQLGTLLNERGIPLMVLNACQSAQPDERNPFASVAARLIEAGVGGVVAMNHSVLVVTAQRLTAAFYGELARGRSAARALDEARRQLFRDTRRITRLRPHQEDPEIIHLQDWFLPALYQQEAELCPFSPLSPAPRASAQGKGGPGGIGVGFPPPPLHGFHGRARELLDLERTFAGPKQRRQIVILHGFGGQGKTALAAQAAEWFTRSGLFERAVFISFESGIGLDVALTQLGNALVQENFQIYPGDKAQAVRAALQATPTLLVFDNFESILPNGHAALPPRRPESPARLHRLLLSGAGQKSKVAGRQISNQQSTIRHPDHLPQPLPAPPGLRPLGQLPPQRTDRPGAPRRPRPDRRHSGGAQPGAPAAPGAGTPARIFARPPALAATGPAATAQLFCRAAGG